MQKKTYSTYAECLEALQAAFIKSSDLELAASMSKYMKYQFQYFGIKSPLRQSLFAAYKAELLDRAEDGFLVPLILHMWTYKEREFHYCAMELLYQAKKSWTQDTIELIEKLIITNSWWDTVDYLASKISGLWFQRFPENKQPYIFKWMHSNDLWLNRAAILHQLNYKNKTDSKLLLETIQPHILSPDFFHRKAIGWALRQYSRTNPEFVLETANSWPLSPLSRKEALRLIKP